MNVATPNLDTSLPWLQQDQGLDAAVFRLISEYKKAKTNKKSNQLPAKKEASLRRQYKDAKQSRSPAGKFMRALADAIGFEDPESAYIIANMKDWERAKEKFAEAARNTSDLGRGRIYLNSLDDYESFMSLLSSKRRDGTVTRIKSHGVKIIPDSISNYLESARKSGFAGSVNFDVKIDVGKGRHGKFEVQVMPHAYQEVDKISHFLFDMIRILEEVKESYLTEEDKRVMDSLILANQALFIEHGIRSGFVSLRKDKLPQINDERLKESLGILDRIWTELGNISGRRFAWIDQTRQAMTEAKTSLTNINLAQKNKHFTPGGYAV